MKIRAFAPASAGNFLIGFDTLGAAFASMDQELFGDIVTIEENSEAAIEVTGRYAHKLPNDPNKNIVTLCRNFFHDHLATKGITRKNFILGLEKCLPICSGLGSSGASIVATLVALNEFYGHVFTKNELLIFAGEMEKTVSGSIHYDNVAPSLLGKLQLITSNKKQLSETLPFFDDWFFVVYYPGIEVSTCRAREILPETFSLPVVTNYWQKLASFVHGLYRQDKALVASLLQDDLIEPYRSTLVPEFAEIRAISFASGAFAFGLSGSGPTCLAITDSLENARHIQSVISDTILACPEAFCRICTLDQHGARILKENVKHAVV
ncbi:MAG: homoserine kinase [Gammaproteobacteria bacterium]